MTIQCGNDVGQAFFMLIEYVTAITQQGL